MPRSTFSSGTGKLMYNWRVEDCARKYGIGSHTKEQLVAEHGIIVFRHASSFLRAMTVTELQRFATTGYFHSEFASVQADKDYWPHPDTAMPVSRSQFGTQLSGNSDTVIPTSEVRHYTRKDQK